MVIYEVNITIDNEVYDDFLIWLRTHVEEMLGFTGFEHARLSFVPDSETKVKNVAIHYEVATIEDLNTYFKEHARSMRSAGMAKFGEHMSITRRTLSVVEQW